MEDEIKLRMIVLNKSSPDDTNTVKLANEILIQIKGGATFEEMASVYSQGSHSDWAATGAGSNVPCRAKTFADAAWRSSPARSAA